MKKLSYLALLMFLCLPLAAQAQEEAPKVEISGGYSYLRLNVGAVPDVTAADHLDTNGYTVSFAGNLAKHVGIVTEFGQYFKSESASNLITGVPSLVSG